MERKCKKCGGTIPHQDYDDSWCKPCRTWANRIISDHCGKGGKVTKAVRDIIMKTERKPCQERTRKPDMLGKDVQGGEFFGPPITYKVF